LVALLKPLAKVMMANVNRLDLRLNLRPKFLFVHTFQNILVSNQPRIILSQHVRTGYVKSVYVLYLTKTVHIL
jgi:hypothetical protein